MTLVSSIISDAYRETQLTVLGATPTANEITEALNRLNSIILSTVGNEVGDGLDELNIGGTYDQSILCSSWVPDDARLMLNLAADTTFLLDPSPYEGQRLSIVDISNNLATNSLVLDANGRLIESAETLTLSTDGMTRQWLYRSDIGTWVKIVTLISSDEMPFPADFDDYFITVLAMRLNPRHSATTSQETLQALKRSRSQIRGRYHNFKQVRSDVDTNFGLANPHGSYGYTDVREFNFGRPWFWR